MTRKGPRPITVLQLVVLLTFGALSGTASGQDDTVEAMETFFSSWSTAMEAGDEANAKQLARLHGGTATKVATAIGSQARAAFKDEDQERAFVLFTATLTLFEHLDDEQGIATASNDLGVFYHSVGDCHSALPNFIRASDMYRKLSWEKGRTVAAHGIEVCVHALAIPDPSLSAIANLKVGPKGSQVIVFNPEACDRAGSEVCGFYLVHEYAHVFLNHAKNQVPLERSEPEADCWAAKQVSTEWAVAVHAWFVDGAASPPVHGSREFRAQRIRACAGF